MEKKKPKKMSAKELEKKYNIVKQGIIDLGYPIEHEDLDFKNEHFSLWSTIKSKNSDYDIHFEFTPDFEYVDQHFELTGIFRLELGYWIDEDDISEEKRTWEFHKAVKERTDKYNESHKFSNLYHRKERELHFLEGINVW